MGRRAEEFTNTPKELIKTLQALFPKIPEFYDDTELGLVILNYMGMLKYHTSGATLDALFNSISAEVTADSELTGLEKAHVAHVLTLLVRADLIEEYGEKYYRTMDGIYMSLRAKNDTLLDDFLGTRFSQ